MRRGEVKPAWSLVFFTVLTQAAAGIQILAMWYREEIAGCGRPPGAEPVVLLLLAVGMAAAALHLRRPGAARFSLSNLRSSRLSQELLMVLLFGAAVAAELATNNEALGWLGALAGVCLVLAIARVYMIRTVPAWNTLRTPISFLITTMMLGAIGLAVLLPPLSTLTSRFAVLAALLAFGQMLPTWTPHLHANRDHTDRRRMLMLRVMTLLLGAAVAVASAGGREPRGIPLAAGMLLASELLGRHLFYAMHRRVGL